MAREIKMILNDDLFVLCEKCENPTKTLGDPSLGLPCVSICESGRRVCLMIESEPPHVDPDADLTVDWPWEID